MILFIALLVFGPSKLSELGKGLGQGIKNFKDAVNDDPEPRRAAAAKKDTPAATAFSLRLGRGIVRAQS